MADLDLSDGATATRRVPDLPDVPGPRGAVDGSVATSPPRTEVTAGADLRTAVCSAVAVGWTMTTLYRTLVSGSAPSADEADHLPGDAELRPAEAVRRHLERIRLGLAHLTDVLPESEVVGPEPDELLGRLQDALTPGRATAMPEAEPVATPRELVREMHVRILSGLSASDIRLGKAYDLGTSLADLALVVGEQAERAGTAPAATSSGRAGGEPGRTGWGRLGPARRRLGRGGVREPGGAGDAWPLDELLRLHDEVRDLATVLPEHAGAPVRESLAFWRAYLQGGFSAKGGADDERDVLLLLQRQIHVWKALLLGEKSATDSLTLAEYLSAGLCTVRRIQREAARVVRAAWPVLTLLVLATGAVVAAAVIYASGTAVSTTVFAAVTTALGAGWKSTRAPLVRVLDRYSDSLRDAEIDAAIARAISILPTDAPREQIEQQARMQVAVPHARRESGRLGPPGRSDQTPRRPVGASVPS